MTNEKDLEAAEIFCSQFKAEDYESIEHYSFHTVGLNEGFLAGIAHARKEDKEKIEKLEKQNEVMRKILLDAGLKSHRSKILYDWYCENCDNIANRLEHPCAKG